MQVRAQIAMVMNLDKCIGCHTCSVTCKNVWTSREGMEYAWFNNVETKPGIGYPKDWENQKRWRGGWQGFCVPSTSSWIRSIGVPGGHRGRTSSTLCWPLLSGLAGSSTGTTQRCETSSGGGRPPSCGSTTPSPACSRKRFGAQRGGSSRASACTPAIARPSATRCSRLTESPGGWSERMASGAASSLNSSSALSTVMRP